MRIWINCGLKEWDEYIIDDVLEWGNNSHVLVHIVQSRKLDKWFKTFVRKNLGHGAGNTEATSKIKNINLTYLILKLDQDLYNKTLAVLLS